MKMVQFKKSLKTFLRIKKMPFPFVFLFKVYGKVQYWAAFLYLTGFFFFEA